MKDERIDILFEALKNEGPSVQANEVLEWLDHQPVDLVQGKSKVGRNIKMILLGLVGFIASLLFILPLKSESNEVKPQKKNDQKIVVTEKEEDSTEAVIHFSEKGPSSIQKQPDVVSNAIDSLYVEPAIVPDYDYVHPTHPEKALVNEDNYVNIQADVPSVQPEIRDLLFILDSLKSYGRPAARYTMDEPDCYLQIDKDYAVISYRFRNRTYFSAGTIHREETQEIDGKSYQVYAFQADNNVVSSNFGNRVFFGYRIVENRSNAVEILFFNQPWAPTSIVIGHTASQDEKRKLMERSKAQE